MKVADEIKRSIVFGPQRETGVWNETFLWFMISVLGRSIKLMTTFFDYFIISHPLIVLCIYLLLYCCLGKYIADFGKLLRAMDIDNDISEHGHRIDNQDWFDKPCVIPSEFSSYKEDGSFDDRYNGFHKVIGKRKKGRSYVRRRIVPQTPKSTPVRYQKDAHRRIRQGARRPVPVQRRGHNFRPRKKKRYPKSEKNEQCMAF